MTNEVTFNPHQQILKGVNKLADAVQSTLGPSGRNVVLYNKRGFLITKDGVTVARHITLSDDLENVGAQMVKEVACKSNELAGDGTTTATVLARAIYEEGLKFIVAGHNPIDLKREIDKVVEGVVDELKRQSKVVGTEAEINAVSRVSTNNDIVLADLISRGIHTIGPLGTISVEDSKTDKTELRFVEGLQLERGVISNYFFNKRLKTVYSNPRYLILNHEVDNLKLLMPVLEWANKSGEPLVLVAHEYEDNLLAALIANHLDPKNNVKLLCLLAPGSGDYQSLYMEDLAKATGATILQPDYSPMLEDFKPEHLGISDKIISNFYETSVIGLHDISAHIDELKKSIEEVDDEFYKNRLKDRYARLTSGIAILGLASTSDTEHKDKKLRVEDAINATKCAVKEGIVAGGGIALYKCRKKYPDSVAEQIISKALESPIRAILKNAALQAEEILMGIDRHDQFNYGYNARTNEFGDMVELGVPDPFLVVKSSLINAASVAGMLLTTSCCVHQEEKT